MATCDFELGLACLMHTCFADEEAYYGNACSPTRAYVDSRIDTAYTNEPEQESYDALGPCTSKRRILMSVDSRVTGYVRRVKVKKLREDSKFIRHARGKRTR